MSVNTYVQFPNSLGAQTATANTVIQPMVQPRPGWKTRILKAVVTAAGTAHTLTIMRPTSRTTASAAAASGQAVVNFTADPGVAVITVRGQSVTLANAMAANDFVAIRETDGVTRLYKISSVSTLAVTMTGNLTAGCASGADIWFFGITTDTDPYHGLAHQKYTVPASATTVIGNDNAGCLSASENADEPILFNDNNATAAGTVEQVQYSYMRQ